MSTRDAGLVTEIVTDPEAFARLEPEWNALFGESRRARSPLSWAWMWGWYEVYGVPRGLGRGRLRVVVVRRGGRARAILPLYLDGGRVPLVRVLRFMSTGEATDERTYPEHTDVLCAPGEEDVAAGAVAAAFVRHPLLRVDRVALGLTAPDSLLVRVAALLPQDRFKVSGPAEPAYSAVLDGGFDAYLGRLTANERGRFRRLLKSAGEAGCVGAEEGPELLPVLFDLHSARWKKDGLPGAFSSPRMREFHRRLAASLPPGAAVFFSLRTPDGVPVAALYGFVVRDVFEFYQSGVDTGSSVRSPGVTAHLLLARRLAERGIRFYDLLAGDSDYKRRLGTRSGALVDLLVTRRGSPGAAADALRRSAAAVKGFARKVRAGRLGDAAPRREGGV